MVVVSEKNLKKNYQYLANFFHRKSRQRSTESLREEYKENFTDQILIGRPVSTIDDLLYRFDSISICNEEEDSGKVICKICRKTEILVTRKFCAECLCWKKMEKYTYDTLEFFLHRTKAVTN